MELTVLGKYGPYPPEGGATSSYLLRCGAKNILIDCGSGSLSRLQKYCAFEDINAVFLSHLHFDHVADMFVLRYAMEALKKRDPGASPLPVYMPGAPADVAALISACPMFDVHTITSDAAVTVGGANVTFAEMTHPVKCFAMRFECDGKVFVYSGDTAVNERIVPFAKGADLLLMECAFVDADWHEGLPHVCATQAASIARSANVSAMLATHIFPLNDESALTCSLLRTYPGARIAQELATYNV